ncbi:MAG: hypothetical protein C0401_03780 [Anaerolinea sp.]|nr:hypothetical protein [Anaerolinea sp.]
MTHIIRNSDLTIKTFTERGDDIVLAAGETLEFSPLSFTDYANRLKFSLAGRSGETIYIPAGSPDLIVSVSCPGEASIALMVNGMPETVTLTNGIGSLTLSAEVPGLYIITPAYKTRYCPAGQATLFIEVK